MDKYIGKFFIVFMLVITPAWCLAAQEETTREEAKIDGDDYVMFAVGGFLGAGIQQLYFMEKPKVESRVPPIVMSYFIWNAIVVIKELQVDDGDDRLYWADVALANAGLTLGNIIWHYTIGRNIQVKSKKPTGPKKLRYLVIGNKPTQIEIY